VYTWRAWKDRSLNVKAVAAAAAAAAAATTTAVL